MKQKKNQYDLRLLDDFDDFLTSLPVDPNDYVVDHAAFFSTRGPLIRARLDAGYTMSFFYSAFSRIFPQKISQKQFEFYFSRYYNPGAANEQPLALEPGRQSSKEGDLSPGKRARKGKKSGLAARASLWGNQGPGNEDNQGADDVPGIEGKQGDNQVPNYSSGS